MRIRVSYLDQNEAFGESLPEAGAVGTVVRRFPIQDWGEDWSLVELEQPITYEGREHSQLVVKSRWEGYAVGGSEPTSVFVLLAPNPRVFDSETVSSGDFEHVAWGMVELIET